MVRRILGSVLQPALVVALASMAARAEVTNLAVVADSFILDVSPANNAGAHTHVAAGTAGNGSIRRGLFRFDTSALPAGSVVTSVEFKVSVILEAITGAVGGDFELHALSIPWGEGSQVGNNGAPATTGEVTWNDAASGTTAWTSPGGDFGPLVASTAINGLGPYTWSDPQLVATVQAWVDTPSANNGLVLKESAEGTPRSAKQFGSREGSASAVLVVGFDPPAPPLPLPLLTSITPGSTNVILTWTNNPDRRYDVLYTERLDGGQNWKIAESDIPAAPNGTNTWRDTPYLASPAYPSNTALNFALRELPASPTGLAVQLSIVVTGLVSPVVATHAGDATDRLFVGEQRGQVLVLDSNRVLQATPFLDLTASVTNLTPGYDERGLLGLAFHPGYATNRKFYVYYSAPKSGAGVNHESRVSEFLTSPTNANFASPATERIVLRFDQPENNHNGGSLVFGPDGFLYISTGDGGGAGDAHPPYGNAQNVSNLLGKILRIDVDGALPYAIPADNPLVGVPGSRPELFAWGLRNPWKVAFDGTNAWVADVGQNAWEEINLLRKGGNYGWRILEAEHAFDLGVAATVGVAVASLDMPVHEYKHGPLGISITGGFVYRGTNLPALQGQYVFGDFSTSFGTPDGALYHLNETRAGLWERFAFWLAPTGGRLKRYVKAFGQDQHGELYLLSTTNLGPSGFSGDVRKLLPLP